MTLNIKKDYIKNYKYGFTHGGTMHSDDVFSGALLKLINPSFKIYRQKNRQDELPTDNAILFFDIGNGRYDHHNESLKYRENGTKFASFGLLLYAFGHELDLSDEEILLLDNLIVEKMDIADNEGTINDYGTLIDRFNPSWTSNNDRDESFKRAVEFAKDILGKEIHNIKNNIVRKMDKKQIEYIYMDAFLKLIDNNLNYKNCGYASFLEMYCHYGKDLLNYNEILIMKEKILRYHRVFNSKNENIGFLRIVNNYDLYNDIERKKCITMIQKILIKDLLRSKSEFKGRELVKDLYIRAKENYILIPYNGISWTKVVTELNNSEKSKDIDYVIIKGLNDYYAIQAVAKKYTNKKDLRKPFPIEWRGKRKESLKLIDNGFLFCHLSGFYCSVSSLESAINLINILNKKENT